ncbi:hypothetical protein [Tumebacillus lipolyticus]|uniref:Uncharacterized protein n=1 Tax=Tumebacillus lipolyticus TaxID=1280370 RepID=A0ABW5A154_9BACL
MKKLLTAAVLSAMLMAPAAVSAAPQDVNAVVAPEATYQQKFLMGEQRVFYGTCANTPAQVYHSTFDGYSGWLTQYYCSESPENNLAYGYYQGWVGRYI